MNESVIIALIGLGGSAIGSLAGVLINTRLCNYRIEQLEKKVDKHNSLVERTFRLEEKQGILEEKQRAVSCRVDSLERRN